MIVSASRRTDIPAFYPEWFINRVKAGFCLTPHPFNRHRVYRVSLDPQVVQAVVFWTKNPAPLMGYLDELDDLGLDRYYFLFTLNHYPHHLEPNLPPLRERVNTFLELSDRLGPERVIWRYDPIIISNLTPFDYHRDVFTALCGQLSRACQRVITSPVNYYRKTGRRLGELEEIGYNFDRLAAEKPEMKSLLAQMAQTAGQAGLSARVCATPIDFTTEGLLPANCIDAELIERLWDIKTGRNRDKGQRQACHCAVSKDIGVSDTCLHHCPYCYATVSVKAAVNNHGKYYQTANSLIGNLDYNNEV